MLSVEDVLTANLLLTAGKKKYAFTKRTNFR